MHSTAATPANQVLRIAVLRITFIASLPLILFSQSAWMTRGWLFELLEVSGILLIIIAVLGRFWAILYIGGRKNQQVMQDGPYSVCRHPLYLFSTIGVIGLGLMLGSLIVTAVLGGLTLLILTLTAIREERYLAALYGAEWQAYAARVPRILPDPGLFHTQGDVTFSTRELRRNLSDALVFLAFIPLAEMMEMLKEYHLVPTFPLW